jgi:hypothetical protein
MLGTTVAIGTIAIGQIASRPMGTEEGIAYRV